MAGEHMRFISKGKLFYDMIAGLFCIKMQAPTINNIIFVKLNTIVCCFLALFNTLHSIKNEK